MSNYDLNHLAQQINQVINLQNPVKFQQFILEPHICYHPATIKILADILAADIFNKFQKVIAASSFKLIYQSILENKDVDYTLDKCWEDYFSCAIDRNFDDLIDWPHLYDTINALVLLTDEKALSTNQDKLFFIFDKYHQTSFQGKLLLMSAIYKCQNISPQNKFLFIRENLENFIEESLNVITNIHDSQSVTPQIMQLQRDTMITIYDWVLELENAKEIEHLKEWDIIFTLSINHSVVNLIKQQLKCVLQVNNGQISYRKSENLKNLVELYDKELINNAGNKTTERMVEHQLEIKSCAISLLQFFLNHFATTADLNQFDTFAILSMAELLTPIFVTQLAENELLKQDYLKQEHNLSCQLKQLTISILLLLKRSSQFNFLLEVYIQCQQTILYRIFDSYLKTTENQLQAYESYPSEFNSYNENFIGITENQNCSTAKEACSLFFKYFFELNNKALGEYLEFLAESLRYRVLGVEGQAVSKAKSKGYGVPESEMVYAVVSRIYFTMDSNHKVFKFIYNNFLDHKIVFKMTGIAKSRVLIFLNYSYARYYAENPLDGLKFIQWTAETKQNSQTEFKIVMELLAVAFDYGIPNKVWEYVNSEIQTTTNYLIFKLIKQLLDKDLDSIQASCVLQATKRISNRIKNEFANRPPEYFLQHQGNEYSIFIKCFHLLQQISEYEPMINKYDVILNEVMDVVDFFHQKDVEKYEFGMEVVVLLNNILKAQEEVPIQFERYLKMLENIAMKSNEFGSLMKTYYWILLKAGDTFEQNPDFLKKIKDSLQKILLQPLNWQQQQLVIEALFLLSNILLVYPQLCQQTREVFLITQNVLQNQKQSTTVNRKLCAAILIYWMSGEYAFGNYELVKLAESQIDMFRDQFGLMFAQCLKKLIQKYFDTQSLETLLKLAIRLLDYEVYYKKQKDYRGPKFTIGLFKNELNRMDAFEEIAQALEFLKGKLNRDSYERAIEFMKHEYGGEALSKLLSVRIMDHKKQRVIYSVRKG